MASAPASNAAHAAARLPAGARRAGFVLFKARAMLFEQHLEDRAVTAGFVCTIASHRKGRVLRKGRQETEEPPGGRALHLGPVSFGERLPLTPVPSAERELDELL